MVKHVVLYSGGHSSALAAIETVRRYGAENTILLNHDINPRTEDADIKRFKREVAEYLGLPIAYANMADVSQKDHFDVCVEQKAFKYGMQSSAICTRKLKMEPFSRWLSGQDSSSLELVYGFDETEQKRIARRTRIMGEQGYRCVYPLTSQIELRNIEDIGIRRPDTYKTYRHANCIGCLKAGRQHWYCVYCLRPDIWDKAKWAEQKIGYTILKGTPLSLLEPMFAELKLCQLQATELIKPQTFWASARRLLAQNTKTAAPDTAIVRSGT
ncbi:MAG: hypothetical protein E6123_06590 [Clostridiales bacterium]|nr:hypothetical protein [Clostridiales bacterium]